MADGKQRREQATAGEGGQAKAIGQVKQESKSLEMNQACCVQEEAFNGTSYSDEKMNLPGRPG